MKTFREEAGPESLKYMTWKKAWNMAGRSGERSVELIHYLSRIELFKGLNMEELEKIEPVTSAKTYPKGTLVTSPLNEADKKRLYLVKEGTVKLYKLSDGGKELTVDLLGTGHIFGEIGSFTTGSENLYAAAWEDAVICSIDREQFEGILSAKPALAFVFIEALASRLKEMEEMLEHMAYGSVRKRVLYLLGKLQHKFGAENAEESGTDAGWIRLEVRLTHQELAGMAGSIRETVTDLLGKLAAEGIVRGTGHREALQVHPGKLRAALKACP